MDGDNKEHKHKVRDWWDKLDIISKFVTAGLVTMITIVGTSYLNKQQDRTRSSQLYSEFMSEREKAENQVRKDMFEKVLAEFWHRHDGKRCILDEIDQQLLQLELISRNFHETLDLSPLFSHVLLKIVRNINADTLVFPKQQIVNLGKDNVKINFTDTCSQKAYRRLLRNNHRLFNKELASLEINKFNKDYDQWQKKFCRGKTASQNCSSRYILSRYIRDVANSKKRKLIRIAGRIRAKQMESLSDVVRRIRLKLDLNKTCVDSKPSEKFIDDEMCYQYMNDKRGPLLENTVQLNTALVSKADKGYETCTIEYHSIDEKTGAMQPAVDKTTGLHLRLNDKDHTSRCFRFMVQRSYPRWNQVYVNVITNRTEKEIEADRDGGIANKHSFWVSFFDFPLADNTYLSSKERFAVVLEDMDDEKRQADLSLIYFPAVYAGFKEKAFYQERMLNTLLQSR